MTLAERLKEAKAKAAEECNTRGHHKWDHVLGKPVSGGGERVGGTSFGPDIPEPEYTERWFSNCRTCVDCGKSECQEDINVWKYDLGLGHYVCDPRTGEKKWVGKNDKT